nr:uncharacterized protein LOC113808232 [Penaeus vannamei]
MNRWILEMRGHTSKMKYIKGKQNFAADMLCIPVYNVKVITGNADILGLSVEEFKSKEGENDKWMAVMHDLEGDPLPGNPKKTVLANFELDQGLLHYGKKRNDGSICYSIVVPKE